MYPRREVAIIRRIVIAALAALLIWQVVTRSLVAYLANASPELALKIDPSYPQALLNLAEASVLAAARAAANSQPSQDPARDQATDLDRLKGLSDMARAVPHSAPPIAREVVRHWVEQALAAQPRNARALRLLGQIAEHDGDEAKAARYMEAAARTSIRESAAVYWMMRKTQEDRDFDAALYYADALLRTRSQVLPVVMPLLGRMAEDPVAKDKLKRIIATNPPWRSQFFAALPRAVTDARTPLEFLLSAKESITPNNLRDYLSVLIEHKFYELAYYAWLQFLEPRQLSNMGLLFNGSFETPPSGLPFDWLIPAGRGYTVDIAQRTDQSDQMALLLQFGPGRVEMSSIEQVLLLAPGTYRFEAQYRGEIIGRRGLVWRLGCISAPATAVLGQSPMVTGIASDWRKIEFSFSVPAEDCRAQRLRLELDARMASEQLVSGFAWFDEVTVSRESNAQ
jgi:hypothetical protein